MNQLNPKSIPVPKILWDELENVMMIKSKELVYDIAKTLRQDPQVLWKEIRSKKNNLFLLDVDIEDDQHECSAIVRNTKVAHQCRKPTMFKHPYCPEHEFYTLPSDLKQKPQVERISTNEGPLFLDGLTQQVYTIDYERVGYIQNNKCFVFEIETG